MGSLLLAFITFLLSYALLPPLTFSGPLYTDSISPNFTASNLQFVDQSGAFLISRNGSFKAAITNPKSEQTRFYFSIIHVASNTIIWSANRNVSISNSAKLSLTFNGIKITDESDNIIWSTPSFNSTVAALQLQESGNLVLLDGLNVSLWESFDRPTDTIVTGQRLAVGKSLDSVVSDDDLSVGDYRFTVTGGDALLQWNGLTYWKLSMDTKAYRDSNSPVSFLAVNATGLYLFGGDGLVVVVQVILDKSNFRIAKLGSNGRFTVSSFMGNNWVQEVSGPVDNCRIPFICGKIGVCMNGGICSCPPSFHGDAQMNGGCTPNDLSRSLPSPCNASGNGSELNSSVSYLKLSNDMDYFANDFMDPVKHGVNLSVCQDLCSRNCSCLGIFHGNSSGSCYLLQNYLGSIMSSSASEKDRLGYIKILVGSSPENPNGNNLSKDHKQNFPIAGLVLLPSFGFFLLIVIGILCLRRNRLSRTAVVKLGRRNSSSSTELEIISIPGLPIRFDYEELAAATENFKIQIGSGGFGTVYRGALPDKTIVAVKKMTSLGVQGKKEFCTEIAIIGNIHHVNLVRLKGLCVQGRQRFLVYEYMNRGSLDRTIFGNGPVLEWQERFEVALGTARGLAYLHSGCDHKIIHCDVKPENILLHDNLQVKIADFGLSKLLTPEQSSLFTTLRGTRGYLAPEWLTSSAISDKTDVYSYGMVVLEIVRGKKNFSLQKQSHSTETVYFPLYALEMHEKRRYLELADLRLEGRVTSEEVEKLVRVALCCVHEEPMLRPTMTSVVRMLEGGVPLGEPRVESLNFLRFYGRRFTEESTIQGYNEQNEFVALNSTTSGSHNSFSYISSQQVSGPR